MSLIKTRYLSFVRGLAEIYRGGRGLVLVVIYVAVATFSLYLAYEIRFDFTVPPEHQQERIQVMWLVVVVKMLALFFARQMGSMVTFFGISDFFRLSISLLASAALLLLLRFTGYGHLSPPRGVLLIDFLVCLATFCGFRLSARLLRERVFINPRLREKVFERVAIIGGGDTGASLVNDLVGSPARGLRPVAILDDNVDKHGRFIHGIRVEGKPEDFASIPCLEGVRHAIIAMPSASNKRVAEIALFLGRLGVKVGTVPAIEDLASGKARVSRTRPIEIQDLLGRPVVELDTASIRHFVEHKTVLVTGAGGSIGSELCRQIAGLNPHRLLLLDQSEPSLFLIEQELQDLGFSGTIFPCIGDVLDTRRIRALFATHSPHVVFHAAAHKHVSLMERQPAEAIKNNAAGTRKLAEIAISQGVEAFVLISTDKAINPTSVMGASKRLAELHLQALHELQVPADCTLESNHDVARIEAGGSERRSAWKMDGTAPRAIQEELSASGVSKVQLKSPKTKLMAVRFGNVLGSSGSVVPIFKRQIESGGPVTVTHPDVTRYFMTIPEAVGLVLQASALGRGGEIFCLDMGQPVKILNLARNMIELSGYKVGEDIEIKFTGLKPGEKLFEELQHHTEQHIPTTHPRVMRFLCRGDASTTSRMAIDELEPFVDELTGNDIKRNLKVLIPEYEPCFE
jgi:FlaA1/EpsC-like NDP-sugar epimerase